jgi:hypothetical protein
MRSRVIGVDPNEKQSVASEQSQCDAANQQAGKSAPRHANSHGGQQHDNRGEEAKQRP